MIVTLALGVGLTGGAIAAPPGQNPHALLRGDNAEEHACLEPAGQRAEGLHCFTSLGSNRFAGRVRALVVRPDDPNTIWAATASGGLWVTHDAGSNWSRGGDITRTLVFSSLAFDLRNPDVMYAGSGEIHTTLHRIIGDDFQPGDDAGLSLRTARRGFGIFKTTDGGAHWSELSQTTLNKNFFYVSRIAVNHDDSNRVLAATATGLWRTSDGGATWTRAVCVTVVSEIPFRIPCAGIFLDVKFHSHDPSNVVASAFGGRVWFSTDSGFTFNASTLPTSVPASASENDPKRVELAFVRSQPGVWLAAQIFANGNSSPIVLLRSIDNGATFSVRSDADGIGCFNNRLYSGALFVSDFGTHVFVGGVQLCHRMAPRSTRLPAKSSPAFRISVRLTGRPTGHGHSSPAATASAAVTGPRPPLTPLMAICSTSEIVLRDFSDPHCSGAAKASSVQPRTRPTMTASARRRFFSILTTPTRCMSAAHGSGERRMSRPQTQPTSPGVISRPPIPTPIT
jgi:photosystem II stability/assembly factor-like uncharacterized protein